MGGIDKLLVATRHATPESLPAQIAVAVGDVTSSYPGKLCPRRAIVPNTYNSQLHGNRDTGWDVATSTMTGLAGLVQGESQFERQWARCVGLL